MDPSRPDLEGLPPTLAGLPDWVAGRFPKALTVGRVSKGEIAGLGARELRDRVRDIALGLGALGLTRGDRLAIVSESRPEWLHVDLAAQTLGVIDVPIYPTLSASQTEYILRDSGARFAAVSTSDQLAKIREVAPRVPLLETVIVFDAGWAADPFLTEGLRPSDSPTHSLAGTPTPRSARVAGLAAMSLTEVAEQGSRRIREGWGVVTEHNDAAKQIQPGDLATIIYTSGTTGEPKGVMLTHHNLITNLVASAALLQVGQDDVALSFLPLSHSFERLASYLYLAVGVTIVFAESMETVARDLQIVKPTVITGVPRVYEKLYSRVLEKGASATGLRKKIFQWAVKLAHARGRLLTETGKRPEVFEGIRAKIADTLVLSKVREAVGGRVRFMVSGSAALPAQIGQFFYGSGLTVMEGYGLTETSPVLTVTPHTGVRFGAVGKAIPGVELRIAEDGEILARGPNVMQGYYNKPAETAEVLKDGWFHTGDIGSIDADGYLHITDRKKELIVTTGGKKLAPQPLEARLKAEPIIDEAIIVGEGRKFPAVLFVPNVPALARALGEPESTDPASLTDRPEARALFQRAVDAVNKDLGQFEKLKKFAFLPKPLSQAENELTPTLKVRRKVIEQKYRDVIERLYA